MAVPTISLVAIVKNEESWVQSLLNHHRDLYDEALIVDTGSDDATMELARGAGARVMEFPWNDNFAAARNAGLDEARGDWVLCIDADERIAQSDFPRLREAMSGPATCYLLPQWNYYDRPNHNEWQPVTGRYPEEERGQAGYFVAMNSKFFPLHPDLRWTGRVHEELVTAARSIGMELTELDVPIHHYGYVKSAEANEKRKAYYSQLVRMKSQERPDNPATILEYAYALIQECKAREAITYLEKLDQLPVTDLHVSRARVMLAKLWREEGRWDDVENLLKKVLEAEPDWIFAWVEMLRFYGGQELWPQVEELLPQAREAHGNHPLFLKEECRLLISTGQVAAAGPLAEELVHHFPQIPEYRDIAAKCRELAERESCE